MRLFLFFIPELKNQSYGTWLTGFICGLAFYTSAFGQQPPPAVVPAEQKLEEQIENLAQQTDEGADYTEMEEMLRYYADNPLNLNKASREELRQLGLLSDRQIENLLMHIKKFGPLLALEELQAVEGYDLGTIYSLLPYVTVTSIWTEQKGWFRQALRTGRHTVILRTERILETRKGFLPVADNSTSQSYYLGDPWKYYLRYRFVYQRRISAGMTAEKDAGEEFFKGSQKSFDFYSAHLTLRDLGLIKTLAAGDYSLSYGQGLLLWTGLAFGKTPEVMMIKKNPAGIQPYTSVNESAFKRGMAVSLGKGPLTADVFFSLMKKDGTLADTVNQTETFSSFFESGFHRSANELDKKHAIGEKFLGGHLQYSRSRLTLGATMIHTAFDKSLMPEPAPYNRFFFRGKKLNAAGADYHFLWRNISFFGELARSDNGAVAYLNGLVMAPDAKVSFALLNRHYPWNYHSFTSNPFRESSQAMNEHGTYFGLMIKPERRVTLSAYYDMFAFPWLRYQVHSPSEGYEYMLQIRFVPEKKISMYGRYRFQSKPYNASGNVTPVDVPVEVVQKNYRYDLVAKVSRAFTLHSRMEYMRYAKADEEPESGFLILQDIIYKPPGGPVSFSLRYAHFDTRSYDSRIYAYENDILYVYSIPPHYYRGSRYYLTLRVRMNKSIDLWARYAAWIYTNRKTIGSGQDEIEGNRKSEIKLQVRFQF